MNPASWLPLAEGGAFAKPKRLYFFSCLHNASGNAELKLRDQKREWSGVASLAPSFLPSFSQFRDSTPLGHFSHGGRRRGVLRGLCFCHGGGRGGGGLGRRRGPNGVKRGQHPERARHSTH